MLAGSVQNFHRWELLALEAEFVAAHRKLLVPTYVEVLAIVTFWSFLLSHDLMLQK